MTGTLNLPTNGLVVGTNQLIVSGGNVGIGTAFPTQKLDVNGYVRATSFVSTSDERLKTNVETIEGLEGILKLRGVRFDWKSDGVTELGFIAQEVEKIYPELVVTDPVTGYKSVRYQGLISPLVQATKELYLRCEATREQSEELKERLVDAEREIASLRNQVESVASENASLRKLVESLERRLEALEGKK